MNWRYPVAMLCVLATVLGVVAAPPPAHAVEPSGSVTDPDDDAVATPVSDPDPDGVSATVSRTGSDLLLQVRFKPGTFNAATTVISFVLDIDRDPSTGSPGIDSACVNDADIIGGDFLVFVSNGSAGVFVAQVGCNVFSVVGNGIVTSVTDGVDVTVPLSLLGGSDGRLNFKAVVGDSSGVIDVMPDVGLPPGDVRSFVDVPSTYPFYGPIETMVDVGLTGGCSVTPALFCPDDPVTRGQIAVFLVRAVHGAGFVPPPATGIFTDVPADHPFAAFVEQLFNDGVTQGCGPGVFCPEAVLTRGEIAVLLLRALGVDPPAATGLFDDVPLDHPLVRFIEELARRGITNGCGATTFCPSAPVTRKQAAAFLIRAFFTPP